MKRVTLLAVLGLARTVAATTASETLPGKGFYPMMRFYSPKAGLFDGTWKLPDIEVRK
jgi:hypothetical protein